MGPWVTTVLLAGVLLIAAIADARTHKVPNWLTYPAIALGLVWSSILGFCHTGGPGALTGFEASLLGLGSGLVPFAIIFAAGGLGGGDVKLAAVVGAISADWRCVLATAVYSFILGAAMALAVLISRGLIKRTGSRLFGAALMAMARVKPEIPNDTPRIPFATAMFVGGTLAAAEVLLGLHTPWAAFNP